MPDVTFQCPSCQEILEAPEEMAGEITECPMCQQQIQIPAPLQQAESGSVDEVEHEPAAEATGPACPSCGMAMEPGAVLCVECGFHLTYGKKMTTDLS
jgi:DNA-directed RNA polymerase subunit M/transcription elongation factor TFIIS